MTSEFPDDPDGQALKILVEEGHDLSRPMDIDFQIAAHDEESALQISTTVSAMGYRTEVFFEEDIDSRGEASEPWTVECSKVMVLTYDGIVAVQEELNTIARPLAGYVDGWETFGNADG